MRSDSPQSSGCITTAPAPSLHLKSHSTRSASAATAVDEDWRKVTDQASRKRIQNRLAQRNYRKNLKRRIEELERQDAAARAFQDAQNGSQIYSGLNDFGGDNIKNIAVSTMDTSFPSQTYPSNPHVQLLPGYYIPHSRVEYDMKFAHQHPDQLELPLPVARHQSYPDMNRTMFLQSLASPGYNSLPVMPPRLNGYHEPFMPNAQEKVPSPIPAELFDASYASKMPSTDRKISRDDQGSQTDLPSGRELFPMLSDDILWDTDMFDETSPPALTKGTLRDEMTASTTNFPPLSLALQPSSTAQLTPRSEVKPDNQGTKSGDYFRPFLDTPTPKTTPVQKPAEKLDPVLEEPILHRLPENADLDDRFDFILECVRIVGFSSFDSMVSAYYTVEFSDTSIVSNVQKFSRNRRLPGILADLREKTKTWTPWEVQGYRDEILKSAEDIFVSECHKFADEKEAIGAIPDLCNRGVGSGQTDAMGTPPNGESCGKSITQAIPSAKKMFQNELPNLWALITALTTETLVVRLRDHSHIVLAVILLLYYSGRIPLDQLQAWVCHCLESSRPVKEVDMNRATY